MDLSTVDPPLTLLREVMGDIVERLGEVRIRRPMLPEWGTLYATTRGIFFVPHEMDQALAVDAGPFTGTSLMWSLGSFFWSPLMFLMPFLGGEESRESLVRVLRPRRLTTVDSAQMPELLMENPGSLFLPRPQIRAITRKRGMWWIERSLGSPLRLSPIDSPRMFQENIARLLASPAWQLLGK
jgi:hypothetical protein